MIKVYVVDDHPIIRAGLAAVLSAPSTGVQMVGEAADIDSLNDVDPTTLDVLILDLNVNDVRGNQSIVQAQHYMGETPIVVHSFRTDLPIIDSAYQAGALAYITKGSEPQLLIEAIHRAAQGEPYYMPGIGAQLHQFVAESQRHSPAKVLDGHAYEVFLKSCQGKSAEEIADELAIKKRTVQNHQKAIKEKLGAHNTRELILLARRFNLIDPVETAIP